MEIRKNIKNDSHLLSKLHSIFITLLRCTVDNAVKRLLFFLFIHSHHCTPFKILLICSARYFHAKPWSMDEGLLQESKTLALHPSSTAFPVDISAIRNYGKRTRPQ